MSIDVGKWLLFLDVEVNPKMSRTKSKTVSDGNDPIR